MVLLKISALLLALVTIQALIYPPPVHEQFGTQFLTLKGICSIFQLPLQHQVIDSHYYLNKILKRLNNHNNCQRSLSYNPNQHTLLNLAIISTIKAEGYQIEINEQGILLRFSDYSGYVYALESLSQIVKGNKVPFAMIKDGPLVGYRGLMIDSSRHFLSLDAIKRLLESMPLSKLNILHWHLTDDQAFTIVLKSHPELAATGSYSAQQTYSLEDMKSVIALANLNAIQVVPEIDTPSHAHCWGLNPQWADLVLKCPGDKGFDGQFDLSKDLVYTYIKDIIQELDQIFANSPYLHFGGDEIWQDCWDLQPQIQNFMKAKNISNYGQLQMYWRAQLKSVISPDRKVIFWLNVAANVTTSGNDILQYWGDQASVAEITAGNDSPIILSPINPLYLSLGQGNLWLNGSQGVYAVWKTIYYNFTLYPQGVDKNRILGAEACLWGEVSNEDTLENNLWMRSSAFASRVWTEKMLPLNEIVASLVNLQKILEYMGVDPSPVTSEFCQNKPEVCFPPKEQRKESQTQSMVVEI